MSIKYQTQNRCIECHDIGPLNGTHHTKLDVWSRADLRLTKNGTSMEINAETTVTCIFRSILIRH